MSREEIQSFLMSGTLTGKITTAKVAAGPLFYFSIIIQIDNL